jgi:hypothetical protein
MRSRRHRFVPDVQWARPGGNKGRDGVLISDIEVTDKDVPVRGCLRNALRDEFARVEVSHRQGDAGARLREGPSGVYPYSRCCARHDGVLAVEVDPVQNFIGGRAETERRRDTVHEIPIRAMDECAEKGQLARDRSTVSFRAPIEPVIRGVMKPLRSGVFGVSDRSLFTSF